MVQHAESPLVQVMQQPVSVTSQRGMHMAKLQVHAVMPFIRQVMVHMPPESIWQRF
jgi:hypothetical protein